MDMDGLLLDRIVEERQRELLEEAARERLVGANRLNAFAVVVRLLDEFGLSRGLVHKTLGQAARVIGRVRGDLFAA
jgi:hypothetical protein